MVIGYDYTSNCTSTLTDVHYTKETTCLNNWSKQEYEYEFYHEQIKIEEQEWTRQGWFNPVKIPLPKTVVNKKIRIQTRNRLPYK